MADDLGFEHELVQPVQSVNGATLYNKVTRGACRPLDLETKQPIDYGSEALLIELDGAGNQVRMSARTDGVNCCHLLRQTLAPIVEEPAGYYVLEPATLQHKTRATVVRDNEGKMVALESGPSMAIPRFTTANSSETVIALAPMRTAQKSPGTTFGRPGRIRK